MTNGTAHQRKEDGAVASLPSRWDSVAAVLRAESGENNYKSWIAPLVPLSAEGGVLTLAAPTRFLKDWVKTHYEARIRDVWSRLHAPVARVEVVIAPPTAVAPRANDARPAAEAPVSAAPEEDLSAPLEPRHTFDAFVAGPSNNLALEAARRFAQDGPASFNPLYIHGPVGMGKTHLLQAAAAAIRAARPDLKVVYMSAERFMYRFVQSLRRKDTLSFKAAVREADVLLFDDLQFICGKDATQDEFLSAFNALLDEGKKIAVAADRGPGELEGIGERLRSRLSGGLAVRISAPDEETRLKILRARCVQTGREVPEEVLAFLAARVSSSVRELEGALNRVVAQAEMTGLVLDLPAAAALLADLTRAATPRLTAEDIQKAVADYYKLPLTGLLSATRARALARPRQVAMYLAKVLTDLSLPELGRRFGGRDHTTILHGVRTVESLIAREAGLAADVAALRRALHG